MEKEIEKAFCIAEKDLEKLEKILKEMWEIIYKMRKWE